MIVRGTNISPCGYVFIPLRGTFPLFSVEPKTALRAKVSFKNMSALRSWRNPWGVQQKSLNLYLFLLLQIIANKNNLYLAAILIYLREYFLPLAETKLKASVEKGLNGRSCFDSPDVGDVERKPLLPKS